MSYRRRDSPLHAARAGAGAAYCLALGLCGLVLSHPLALAVLIAVLLGAGAAAGVGRELRAAALWALPLGVAVALVNALVARDGLTVIARLGTLPILGRTDVTLEATAYGGVLGLRAVALILAGALLTRAVDPHELLRAFRRVSGGSALTATLAVRLVPVLTRDGRRLADAQRCRPGAPPSRLALTRAVMAGALERALDVAATLELRGYGLGMRPPSEPRPWSRQDAAFAASALGLAGLAVLARASGWLPLRAYPLLHAPTGAGQLATCAALAALALLPFLDRRGIAA